jgi:hypothetical protein
MSIRKVYTTLNVRKAESQTTIEGLHVGDVGSTQLVISLTDGTRAIDLTKFGTVTAIIHGKKPDGKEIHNQCDVSQIATTGKIYYTLTAQDTAAVGTVDYQLDVTVRDGSGYERSFSPTFRTRVSPVIYQPVFRELSEQPEDWTTDYGRYYRKDGNNYIQIDDDSCPTFESETFYVCVDPPIESVSQYLAFWAAFNKVSELYGNRLVIDSTTENISYSADNIHKVFIKATIQDNIKGVVFTGQDNKQYAICDDGLLRTRAYSNSYSNWSVTALRTAITNANKNKDNLIPSIKAVVDYIAAEISGKADSADVAASLAGKADVNHTHDMSAYITSTALQSALAGKADTDHTHSQYLTEHQDLSAYALIANVTAALALKADKDTAMKYKDITGSAIYQVNDDLISDKKTIYRVFDGLGWGLMFNLITNQQHTQIILREDGHLLYRQKTVNASWHGVTFTDIFGSYVTTSAMNTALAGKADISDIPTIPTNVSAFTNDAGYLTQHQDISGKEDSTNKVTTLSSSSTDTQYPSAKCVYNEVKDRIDYEEISGSVSLSALDNFTDTNKIYHFTCTDSSINENALLIFIDSGEAAESGGVTLHPKCAQIIFTESGRILKRQSDDEGVWGAVTSIIPTKTSELTNDSGFLTQHQSLSGYATTSDLTTGLAGKSDTGHTHSQYLTQHQDISGKEDTSNKDSSISSSTTSAYDAAHYPNIVALKTVYSELYREIQSVDSSIPQATSELTNDSGFLTQHQDISGKADKATTLAGYGITDGQTKIDLAHKLSSDLVDDTNKSNKFVTSSEKTAWGNKYDKPNGGIPKTDLSSAVQTSLGKADSAMQPNDVNSKYPVEFTPHAGLIDARDLSLYGYSALGNYHTSIGVSAGERYIINCRSSSSVYPGAFYTLNGVKVSAIFEDNATHLNAAVTVPSGVDTLWINSKSTLIPLDQWKVYKVLTASEYCEENGSRITTLRENRIDESVESLRRLKNLESLYTFRWKPFDKAYYCFVNDGSKSWLHVMYDVFHTHGMPLTAAVVGENIELQNDTDTTPGGRTVKQTLDAIVADGGEVMTYLNAAELKSTDPYELWYEYAVKNGKRLIESYGYNVRGLILSAQSARNSSIGQEICERFFDYSDRVGTLHSQYDINRRQFSDTSTVADVKAFIDSTVNTPGFYPILFHRPSQDPWATSAGMDEILTHIENKGSLAAISTYSYVFDTFGSNGYLTLDDLPIYDGGVQ